MIRDTWEANFRNAGVPVETAHAAAHAPSYVTCIKTIYTAVGTLEAARLLVITCTGPIAVWDALTWSGA